MSSVVELKIEEKIEKEEKQRVIFCALPLKNHLCD